MTERRLIAYNNANVVGEVSVDKGVWAWTYAPEWVRFASGFSLAPGLPLKLGTIVDSGTERPVQWYFDNLLPEEGQRILLAKDARIDQADAFGLLAYYGAESAGSLTLLPTGVDLPEESSPRILSDSDLSARIKQLGNVPLIRHAAKRMSLAGAQHKLPVTVVNDQLYEPIGSSPSTHILKPNHPDPDYPDSVINEYFCMKLAGRLGLFVPEVERRYVPEPIYLIRRFDREWSNGRWKRSHYIDACQLLNLDRSYKYAQGNIERVHEISDLCRNRPATRLRLFEWLVFIAMTGNGDAHLKNLSFSISHEGIALAPHYDLLSTAVYETPVFNQSVWPDSSRLAWPILGVSRYKDISRSLMLEAGLALRLQKETCQRVMDRMTAQVVTHAHQLLDSIRRENELLLNTHGQLIAATISGEERCLRAIVSLIIRDMVELLSKE